MAARKIYMLQRVQTLYILSATILIICLLFKNFMYTASPTGDEMLYVKFTDYRPFLSLTIGSLAVSLFTFLVFTSRVLQIRCCTYNIILLLAYQGWIAWIFFSRTPGEYFTLYCVFPIIAAILLFIAIKYLARDEALVQASNSLRRIQKNRKGIFGKRAN